MTSQEPSRAVLVAGMAEGFGVALCRSFATAGYDIIGMSRSARAAADADRIAASFGRSYTALKCDVADAAAVSELLAPETARIAVAIYNAHQLQVAPFLETSAADLARMLAVNLLGAASVARALLPAMVARRGGALIFTGATASRRAGAKFAAFAASKFALRGLAQSLAREFGPQGIHISHVLIDGLIEEPQTRRRFPDAKTLLDADALAGAYVALAHQSLRAWTHELDLRTHDERF